MSIEQTLIEIRDELRAIHTSLNAPLRPELVSQLMSVASNNVQPSAGGLLVPEPIAGAATGLVTLSDTPDPRVAFAQLFPTIGLPTPPSPPGPAVFVHIADTPVVGASVAPATPSAELDSAGIPWDGRIHASSKAKVADNTWRLKRGVDKDLVASVTAELKAVMAIPAVVVPPVPGVPGEPPAVPYPPPSGLVKPPITFEGLMIKLGQMMATGQIAQEAINTACAAMGVTIPTLAARQDLVPALAEKLGITL